jgi:imidazolonepropionase
MLGIKIRLHADQVEEQEGAIFSTKIHAHSADHLLHISEDGINAISKSRVIPTIFPSEFIKASKSFDMLKKMISKGINVAAGTHWDPGDPKREYYG